MKKPHLLDLITSTDEQGNRQLSLTESIVFILAVVPVCIGVHSYVMACLDKPVKWDYLPDFCFYAWGCATGMKATKGTVGFANNYYNTRQYPNNNNQGGRTY